MGNDPYAEVYAYINDDESDYAKETTETKTGTVAPVWEEEFTFDDAELTEGKAFTGFQFKLYDADEVFGIGFTADFLGESEVFHTADMKLCGDVYAMPMPLYRGTIEQGSVFVEVSMDNCCLEEDDATDYEEPEEEQETATVEEQGKEKGSKPKE